ncbi:MAG: aldo/keto reductase [Clostridia bacterium]
MKLTDTIKLNNGVEIPRIGYGTWRTPAGEVCKIGVDTAIKAGYRLLDTATVYANEQSVGEAIISNGITREELFVTTKLWNTDQGYDNTLKAFDLSMENLKLDYLDLYLIHWPIAFDFRDRWQTSVFESWRAIERLYLDGRVRAIGVSNFLARHLKYLLNNCKVAPMIDQIEFHIGLQQLETVEYARQNNLVVEAWSPICKAKAFDLPEVRAIMCRTGKTGAQILIRWCLQKGVIPLPKSVTLNRIFENINVFDFELTSNDMLMLDNVTEIGRLGSHPDECLF